MVGTRVGRSAAAWTPRARTKPRSQRLRWRGVQGATLIVVGEPE